MFYDLLIFIFMSYIKPQLVDPLQIQNLGCISYYSYIKPQQFVPSVVIWLVVYRTIPTSNHNWVDDNKQKIAVVYRTIPTSNHNWHEERPVSITLYIVLFLHQTTTSLMYCCCSLGCISYYSYIKPQLPFEFSIDVFVVYRTIPTSNHNLTSNELFCCVLYIVLFLHQTTTAFALSNIAQGLYIVLFLHQTTTIAAYLGVTSLLYIVLFLHQTTTHWHILLFHNSLYIVLFLHQTTTNRAIICFLFCCISYYSYIKPQPSGSFKNKIVCCISYYSYIKPQLSFLSWIMRIVVYRTIPTSNHNYFDHLQ